MTPMQRLKRVFAIDIETCPKCGGELRVIACIGIRCHRHDPRLFPCQFVYTISRLKRGSGAQYANGWAGTGKASLPTSTHHPKQVRDKSRSRNQKGKPPPNRVAEKPPDVIFKPPQTGSRTHVMLVS